MVQPSSGLFTGNLNLPHISGSTIETCTQTEAGLQAQASAHIEALSIIEALSLYPYEMPNSKSVVDFLFVGDHPCVGG